MSNHLTEISSCKWKHGGQDWPLVRKDNDEMEKKENYTHLLWFVHLELCCHSTQPLPWQRQRGRHVRSRHITTLTSSSPSRHHIRPARLAAVRGCQDSLKRRRKVWHSLIDTETWLSCLCLEITYFLKVQCTLGQKSCLLYLIHMYSIIKLYDAHICPRVHIYSVAHPTLNIKILMLIMLRIYWLL